MCALLNVAIATGVDIIVVSNAPRAVSLSRQLTLVVHLQHTWRVRRLVKVRQTHAYNRYHTYVCHKPTLNTLQPKLLQHDSRCMDDAHGGVQPVTCACCYILQWPASAMHTR